MSVTVQSSSTTSTLSSSSSQSIQDCAGEAAAQRRERRRQKILQNAENRISKILAGPDGTDRRQAPSIDGIGNDGTEGGSGAKKLGNNTGISGFLANLSQDRIDYVQPVYCEFVDRRRFGIMLTFGMLFRLLVQFGLVDHVALSFSAIFFAYQFLFVLPRRRLQYPKHGYLVNLLLVAGLNERSVIWFGLFLDTAWEFTIDLAILTFAFLCAHIAFIFAEHIQSMLDNRPN